jgi:hypothetical protein
MKPAGSPVEKLPLFRSEGRGPPAPDIEARDDRNPGDEINAGDQDREPVIAEAECYRITRSVAFTRAFAHQGDPKDPVAAAAGTFMLGTKGEVTRSQMVSRELNT